MHYESFPFPAAVSVPILIVDAEADAESQTLAARPGSAVDVLARTLWGEARGETVRAIEAVAAVVMTLARRDGRQGIAAVCRAPGRFRCWEAANRAGLERVDEGDRVFRICLRIARRAVAGSVADPTGGATRYHRRGALPAWTCGRLPSAEIGNLLFYREEE